MLEQVLDAAVRGHVVSGVAAVEHLRDLENKTILDDILEESGDSKGFQLLHAGAQDTLRDFALAVTVVPEDFDYDLLLCHLVTAAHHGNLAIASDSDALEQHVLVHLLEEALLA